jgi:epsilon-lactone hydrolase
MRAMPSAELENLITMLSATELPDDAPVAQWREAYDTLGQVVPADPGAEVTEAVAGGRPALDVRPRGEEPGRTVLYLHGGGYAIGSPVSHRSLATHLAVAARARVVVLDYRLAPEHRFPAAVDDALGAYRALLDGGAPPSALAVAGDSAGGGLTVATLLAARDAGLPLPACAVCFSPWADLTQSGATIDTKATEDPMVRKLDLDRWAEAYLGDHDPKDPLASPLFGDLGGLPPLLVYVGSREVLLDDSVVLVERVREAGGDATLHVGEGLIHVWPQFAGMVPEGTETVGEAAAWVVACMFGSA